MSRVRVRPMASSSKGCSLHTAGVRVFEAGASFTNSIYQRV